MPTSCSCEAAPEGACSENTRLRNGYTGQILPFADSIFAVARDMDSVRFDAPSRHFETKRPATVM